MMFTAVEYPGHKVWNRERVIEKLRQRHQEGKPITYMGVCRDEPGLAYAGYRYFGSWHKALEAAGLEHPPRAKRH